MMGKCRRLPAPNSPCHKCTSEPQIDAASILTRMAPGSRVSGIGTSRISKGFWNATTQAARLVFGMVLTHRPPQSEGDLLARNDYEPPKSTMVVAVGRS